MAASTVAVRRPGGVALAVVRAVPAWAWLTGLVTVSTLVRYALGRRMVAPWIMVDELIYSELAKSFAASGHFLVRGQSTAAYGVVYPALISPAYRLYGAVPQAYAAAKAVNALVMSLTAVPVYFLARRVVAPWLALLAALLAVAIPSMVYTGMLMTENAFYPLFACAALALVAWLDRPTPLRTGLLLAVCAVAFLTRAQAVALLPAVLGAPFLLTGGRRALREYRLLYALVGAATLLVVVVQAARGASPLGVLGAYQSASKDHLVFGQVLRWFLYHVAELDLSLGVLPFAALLLLAVRLRSLDRPLRIFVAATVALSFWLVLEVAAFASVESLRVEERNMFYVAPLFLIALLAWIERGLPRQGAPAAAAVLVAAALPGVLPYPQLINLNAVSDTLAILPVWSLQPHPFGLTQVQAVVAVVSILAGILLLVVPRRFALVLPALVLAYFAVSQKPVAGKHRAASLGALFAGITNPHRDWIDRAVGRDAAVAAVWSGNTDRYAIWENEIFSRSVGTIYDLGQRFSGGLAETPVVADRDTGILRAAGRPIRARYVLTDGSVSLAGRVVARDAHKGMLLYRASGPLRQTSRVEGLYPQDTWSGPTASYTRLGCRGGKLAVLLESDPALFRKPQIVSARVLGREVASVRVPPGVPVILRIRLRPSRGTCAAHFAVSPTAIPAVVTKGQNPDPRVLGIHFTRFSFTPR